MGFAFHLVNISRGKSPIGATRRKF